MACRLTLTLNPEHSPLTTQPSPSPSALALANPDLTQTKPNANQVWRAAFGFVGLGTGGALVARLLDAAEEESLRSCDVRPRRAKGSAAKGSSAALGHEPSSYTGVLQ